MLNIIFDEKMQTKNIKKHIIKVHKIHETLKDGWQEYNLYFYISLTLYYIRFNIIYFNLINRLIDKL